MRCGKARRGISARLDGVLGPEGTRALEGHLRGCPACRAFAAGLSGDAAALQSWAVPPARWGFAQRVMRRLEAAPVERGALRRWIELVHLGRVGLGAAAFALGILAMAAMNGDGVLDVPEERDEAVVTAAGDSFDALPSDSAGAELLALLGGAEE